MTKVLLDTNLCVGWLNHGLHEALVVGPGSIRQVRDFSLQVVSSG